MEGGIYPDTNLLKTQLTPTALPINSNRHGNQSVASICCKDKHQVNGAVHIHIHSPVEGGLLVGGHGGDHAVHHTVQLDQLIYYGLLRPPQHPQDTCVK